MGKGPHLGKACQPWERVRVATTQASAVPAGKASVVSADNTSVVSAAKLHHAVHRELPVTSRRSGLSVVDSLQRGIGYIIYIYYIYYIYIIYHFIYVYI